MATWEELSQFKWGELQEMQLTYNDLRAKPIEELLSIAQKKLDRFKKLPSEKQGALLKAVPLMETIIATVSANLLTDAVRTVDWKELILQIIELLQQT